MKPETLKAEIIRHDDEQMEKIREAKNDVEEIQQDQLPKGQLNLL